MDTVVLLEIIEGEVDNMECRIMEAFHQGASLIWKSSGMLPNFVMLLTSMSCFAKKQ